ncbi:MAG TPA: c-type cytochrome, partial [Thermoanaerobaculia bacterium]|nr:c-type cytochrome [Thermoanaerobaculia bacterium]
TCHRPDSSARAPILNGVFGTQASLNDGTKVLVNEDYVRESLLNPAAKVVAGYQPVMPTFKGQVSEEELIQLVNYVKSLKAASGTTAEARK